MNIAYMDSLGFAGRTLLFGLESLLTFLKEMRAQQLKGPSVSDLIFVVLGNHPKPYILGTFLGPPGPPLGK